jgi:hypothetical protein
LASTNVSLVVLLEAGNYAQVSLTLRTVVFCLAPQYPPVIVHGVPAVIAPQRRPCAHHRTVARPRPSLRRGRAPLQLVRPYPERAGRCGGGAVRPQGNFVGRHRQRVGDDHHRTDRPLRRLRCTGDYVYVKRGRHRFRVHLAGQQGVGVLLHKYSRNCQQVAWGRRMRRQGFRTLSLHAHRRHRQILRRKRFTVGGLTRVAFALYPRLPH